MSSHALAVALDEFLSLTSPDYAHRRLVEEYHREHSFAADTLPAVITLARLRSEAEREVERLIALMDAIDGDPDLEPSLCGRIVGHAHFAGEVLDGEIDAGEEPEEACEDEGAWDEREQDHRSDDERARVRRRKSAAAALGMPILRHASL